MKRIQTMHLPGRPTRLAAAIAGVLASFAFAPLSHAVEIDTGNPDLTVRWDNQVRYAIGVRGEAINPAFGNSPTYDETEYRFAKNKVVMNRLDLFSEMDLTYKGKYGFRLSAAAWHDQAYHDRKAHTNPGMLAPGLPYSAIGNYIGNDYSSTTKRFHYQGGELLDAFAFANFDLGGNQANVKLGKHTVYWGEAFFTTFHGISYSQAPLDGLKGASSPGIEAKEVFMPINQLSGAVQLSPEWSLRGQYFLNWRPNRLPEGGTYFGAADMLFSGPDRLFAGAAGQIPHGASVEPDRKGTNNFGLNLRYNPASMSDTTFGAYYRKFDETMPWAPVFKIAPPSPVPRDYHLAYAKDTEMLAGSVQTAVGPVSVGGELIYRKNTALNSNTAFVSSNGSSLDFAGAEGARGNTMHIVANGVYLLPRTALWESGVLIGEVVYSRLLKVTKNADLFKGVGYMGCNAATASTTSGAKLVGDKNDGCATKDVLLANVSFTPQWLQVYPGVDLSAPMSIGYGLRGNGATLGGGNEGAYTWSVGLEANIQQKYTFAVKYSDSHARYNTGPTGMVTTVNGNAVQNNHGWLAMTFKTTF
ncbi:DUF1302 domain-containing protein [Ramlibacter sp. WS9]|uniref:DUF1302 domain-containing protein n=1 Tax=Ramlibacter sp. WS9 TaxID=1882741 RepID=UPI001141EF57|nr:DUF1302 family protein [Ramlibacter sp. WS9]ROZ69187.1 DUF1302 family protein [Ramlibacter sp. WS9]